MLSWAEERIRQLVNQHGTARTAVIGANAVASEQDATALLRAAGYRHVFSLVGELELDDLQQVPEPGSELPTGIRTGPIGTSHYRAAWRTVVDSYADRGFTQRWPFQDFVDTADPACWRAAWNGQDMVGVALCSIRRHDHTVGEVEELSVRMDQRRLGIGRVLLLDGLRSLREQVQRPLGCSRARQIRTGPTTFTRVWGSGGGTSTSVTASRLLDRPAMGLSGQSTGFGARQDGWPTTAVT